jgi:hypothetical protein
MMIRVVVLFFCFWGREDIQKKFTDFLVMGNQKDEQHDDQEKNQKRSHRFPLFFFDGWVKGEEFRENLPFFVRTHPVASAVFFLNEVDSP